MNKGAFQLLGVLLLFVSVQNPLFPQEGATYKFKLPEIIYEFRISSVAYQEPNKKPFSKVIETGEVSQKIRNIDFKKFEIISSTRNEKDIVNGIEPDLSNHFIVKAIIDERGNRFNEQVLETNKLPLPQLKIFEPAYVNMDFPLPENINIQGFSWSGRFGDVATMPFMQIRFEVVEREKFRNFDCIKIKFWGEMKEGEYSYSEVIIKQKGVASGTIWFSPEMGFILQEKWGVESQIERIAKGHHRVEKIFFNSEIKLK